ncbi:hypothetical protein C8P68_11243 [Mucilaginibacter yixingensis]|uniref:Cytoskeletal protein CcmA (Bactofilin family) n=1 Tax=Mucilaginibacter yixingensis TaxID=1295612 RepID=A0A2T5J4K8_9SPHI|nr:hypothetical protein [Mucilaginibacter yixingensis]PTQ92443.1 hypothetical protein C8P68_11243 [Mucilaginibacter yixingensis]
MVRSAALYMVIVIALVIGVICSSLIMAAGFYRLQYSKQLRYQQLRNNLQSGINLVLHSPLTQGYTRLSLFGQDNDSIAICRKPWGIFDVGVVRSFIQADTLDKTFTIANGVDSAKWATLYMIDEDRSISVSGKTIVKGNVFIPKAGIRPAYVDGQAYQGPKQIIQGHQYNSAKELPALNTTRLKALETLWKDTTGMVKNLSDVDSIHYSWIQSAHRIDLGKKVTTLSGCTIGGNAVIVSDTLLTIDSTAHLKDVLIFAKAIHVANGFRGRCQLFAADSITTGARCQFDYPSCIGLLRFANDNGTQKITIGNNNLLSGALFTYEQQPGKVLPFVDLGKDTEIRGIVYLKGNVGLHAGIIIKGGIFTNRFVYTSGYTRYENYLININLDGPRLSPYYLSSDLFPVSGPTQKVLAWLN